MNRDECKVLLMRIVKPVFSELAQCRLHETFSGFAGMEAFARCLLGCAPFIELAEDIEAIELAVLARKGLEIATDPYSSDFMPFSTPHQSLVEGGLIAQALLLAPTSLWHPLSSEARTNIINALVCTRSTPLRQNNWVLFGSVIEVFLLSQQYSIDERRLKLGIKYFEKEWYIGDGTYSDGASFHCDYYNSIIIHPLLYQVLCTLSEFEYEYATFRDVECKRLQRWSILLERFIAPDGSYPLIGRSITYRCGVFHALAFCSLKDLLPQHLPPPQARIALTRVIKKTLYTSDTFADDGFLTIGLSGLQPKLAEKYINRGSVYMCCAAFLPLGLSSDNAFWNENSEIMTSWEKGWNSNENLGCDKALDYLGRSAVV